MAATRQPREPTNPQRKWLRRAKALSQIHREAELADPWGWRGSCAMLCNSASGPENDLPSRISSVIYRESIKFGPPAGLRPVGWPILKLYGLESGRNPALQISGPEARLRNIE